MHTRRAAVQATATLENYRRFPEFRIRVNLYKSMVGFVGNCKLTFLGGPQIDCPVGLHTQFQVVTIR